MVIKKDIIVNRPLRYKGVNFFQSSYGSLPPNKVTLNFTSRKNGKVYTKMATVGQQIDLPEGLGTFNLKTYRNSAQYRGKDVKEAFIGTLTPKNGNPIFVLLPLRFPTFDSMRNGDVIVSIAGYDPHFYTGLQVTRDPGVWIVYAGFILIISGFFITTFMSHQRLCIEVIESGHESKIAVAGTSNRNKIGMERKIKKLSEKLANVG